MANQSRRLKRVIQQAVLEFKKSGVTLPPPRKATPAEENAFRQQMKLRVKQITEQLKIVANDATRHGYKRQLTYGTSLNV